MALPPEAEAAPPEAAGPRPELRLIEASEARERRCADCGRATNSWKPAHRKGTSVILCLECAAKPPPGAEELGCPECGARLGPQDAFCGKCGAKIEYACPQCGAVLEPDDTFCGKCGARLA
ncbi:MAG: zinc ribbon domain-containing protein [Thermoplasmata archaeon]